MRLLSALGAVDIGSINKGTTHLDKLSPKDLLIGFYGSYNDEYITSLGFLTHDPSCIPLPEPELKPEVEEKEQEEKLEVAIPVEPEEGGLGAAAIVGIIISLLIVAAAVTVVLLLIKRRRKNKDLGQVESAKFSETKQFKSSVNKQTHVKMQNLGELGD